MSVVFIYGLYDPRYNNLRYIGKATNLDTRLRDHINLAKNDVGSPKSDWIKELLNENLEPIMKVLEESNDENWAETETRWIANSRNQGLDILNVSSGGPNPPDWAGRKQSFFHVRKRVEARKENGNYTHSEETKRKISEHRKGKNTGPNNPSYGKRPSEEIIEKIRSKNLGYKPTEETRKKISIGVRLNPSRPMLGKHLSEETKRKLSESNKGRVVSSETREKLRKVNTGKHPSEETKEKLRQANLGKHHSEETRIKIGLLSKGRPKSEETLKKLGQQSKERWSKSEYKEKMKAMRKGVQKSLWQNPEYRTKMLEAQRKRRERERLEKEANK